MLALLLALTAHADPLPSLDEVTAEGAIRIAWQHSVVIELPAAPRAVAVTRPELVNPVFLGSPRWLQLQGLQIGTTDMVIDFGPGQAPVIVDLTVQRDVSEIQRRIDAVVAGVEVR